MLSAPNLPVHVPDLHDLPFDLNDLSGQVRKVATEGQRRAMDLAARTPLVPVKKSRSRLSLAWPLLAVLAGIGLYMAVRSRRSSSSDVGQNQPSGAYARS